MKITAENYFSQKAEMEYFGSSQIRNFMDCESKTMARIRGDFVEEKSTALLVGSYVDAHFEGSLDVFIAQHPEILTRNGSLRSDYIYADYIIQRIERDEMFMRYMSGECQKIMTGELFGHQWKIKIDAYHPGKAIVDLKVMRDFEPIWVDGQGKIPFVEAWGYDYQGFIYQAIEGHKLPFIIAGATKQKPEPDLALISVPDDALEVAGEIIKASIDRFAAIKAGEIEPARCGVCEWCRRTKVITGIIDYREMQ